MTLYTSTVIVPRKKSSIWEKLTANAAYAVALPISLLVIWGITATIDSPKFFPAPWKIWNAFVATWIGPAFMDDVLPSLGRLALGIILSVVVGIIAGAFIGRVTWLRDLVSPVLEFLRAIPPPAMIPIIAVLLGATDTMKIFVIVIGSIWPVLLNTIDGVKATDSVMQETAKSFSLTKWERIRYLILPAASPRIMAGVRQTLSIALILMVISEMFLSASGLGYRIVFFQRNYLIAEMWSGILLLGLIGILLSVIFGFVEKRVLRWYNGIKEVERA